VRKIAERFGGLVALALSRTAPQTSSRSGRVKRPDFRWDFVAPPEVLTDKRTGR
jgi:hypothetical protein